MSSGHGESLRSSDTCAPSRTLSDPARKSLHDTEELEADPDRWWLTGCWNRALVS